jgi:glutathione peroxidase
MFEKSAVRGPNANPVFRQLEALSNDPPQWNFHKYLVDRDGLKVVSFPAQVAPSSSALTTQIESMLTTR